MSLYRQSGVSVESFVQVEPNVPVRCEVDRLNEQTTLSFGSQQDFTLTLDRAGLDRLVQLGSRAMIELDEECLS